MHLGKVIKDGDPEILNTLKDAEKKVYEIYDEQNTY